MNAPVGTVRHCPICNGAHAKAYTVVIEGAGTVVSPLYPPMGGILMEEAAGPVPPKAG